MVAVGDHITGLCGPQVLETVATLVNGIRCEVHHTRMVKKVSISIRDLVQREANKHGAVFVPRPDTNADGEGAYGFGQAHMYIERDLVYATV